MSGASVRRISHCLSRPVLSNLHIPKGIHNSRSVFVGPRAWFGSSWTIRVSATCLTGERKGYGRENAVEVIDEIRYIETIGFHAG